MFPVESFAFLRKACGSRCVNRSAASPCREREYRGSMGFSARKDETARDSRSSRSSSAAAQRQGAGASLPTRSPARRRRRSLFWGLVRFSFVLAFFGALGLAAVFGYIWFTLNQQGLLKIPDREPGIIILASDGSVLAEKGSFNGDEVRLAELPDYVPNAVIAIEDRRFRSHMGVDPIGLLRAVYRQLPLRPRGSGRFHAHPAAGEEPVPHARPHASSASFRKWCWRSGSRRSSPRTTSSSSTSTGSISARAPPASRRPRKPITRNPPPNSTSPKPQRWPASSRRRAPPIPPPIRKPPPSAPGSFSRAWRMPASSRRRKPPRSPSQPAEADRQLSCSAKQYVVDWVSEQLPEFVQGL